MNKYTILACSIAFSLLAGCTADRDDVTEAQREVTETQAEGQRNVNEAKREATDNVTTEKRSAAENTQEAQRDLIETQREATSNTGTTSGTTMGVVTGPRSNLIVTTQQCADLAKQSEIRPEQREMYKACEQMRTNK